MLAENEKRISNSFYLAKCIATFSIVSAHITVAGVNPFLLSMLKRFSSLGVIMFFIISAYYFRPELSVTGKDFWIKKLKTIVVPWLFLGSITYSIYYILPGNFSLLSWADWLVGYKTYLWYVPVLLLIYLLFYRLHQNNVFCEICVFISCVSLLLTSFGILDSVIEMLRITNYLFVPNWVGIFAIGCLCRNLDLIKKVLAMKTYIVLLVFAGYLAVLVTAAFLEPESSGYFSKFGLLLELTGSMLIFYVCGKIKFRQIYKVFSGCSYSVYLLHFIGIIVVEKLFRPVFMRINAISAFYFIPVTLLIFGIVLLGEYLAVKLKIGRLYSTLSGVRVYQRSKP